MTWRVTGISPDHLGRPPYRARAHFFAPGSRLADEVGRHADGDTPALAVEALRDVLAKEGAVLAPVRVPHA